MKFIFRSRFIEQIPFLKASTQVYCSH